ncbi:MAG: serine/threonine protein kinase [Candidatus Melainabacteria bacterium]|nr:serine/threonine protein kinase [Candidatus Melainabacteria bacterium]
MCAKQKDGRDPDPGNTARGDDAQPDDSNTVETKSNSKSDPELIRGKVLDDKYEIISHLGSGAMGAVYKARHKILNKEVAIKVLQSANLDDTIKKKRFMREARAQGGLTHKNIAAVHDVGLTENDQPFFVMDLLVGESLEEHLEQHHSLNWLEFINIFEQVARGLQHAHSKNIVHRDIKPSNIMLIESEDGDLHALVVDFGIAVINESDTTKLTREGYIVGTPHYMSPEQIEGKQLDARSDVYSLGCVMFEALTGNPPFQGINAPATMALHIAQQPEHITSFNTKSPLPAGLADLVMRCIDKDPEKRFSTAKEIAALLNSIKTASTEKEKSNDFLKAASDDILVGAGKGHQSNPAHAPSIPEIQTDNQKDGVNPLENKSANNQEPKIADKIELKEHKSLDEPAEKTRNKTKDSGDSIEQSNDLLQFENNTDSRIKLKLEAERVQAHIPSGSNSISSDGAHKNVPSSSSVAHSIFEKQVVIRLIAGALFALILWPAGGRLALPLSAAEMRDDNLFFIIAKFLVDNYNQFATDAGWQYIVLGVIIFFLDKVVQRVLKHFSDL